MFLAHKRNLPHVEDQILERLGPRDLVAAKQASKGWATAVQRYIEQLDPERTSDLMTEAFLEPVQVYAIVKLPQTVRDLSITQGKEVYILGDDCVIQLDAADFHVRKCLLLDKILWCHENEVLISAHKNGRQFEVGCKGCWPIRYSWSGRTQRLMDKGAKASGVITKTKAVGIRISDRTVKMSKKHLENLQRGLSATDIASLANGFLLFSVEGMESEDASWIFAYKAYVMAPRLIAMVPLKNAKLSVIGTRVLCHSGQSNSVVVFDMWNPKSVEVGGDNIDIIEGIESVERGEGYGAKDTPCIICSRSNGRLYICDDCLYDEELGIRQ